MLGSWGHSAKLGRHAVAGIFRRRLLGAVRARTRKGPGKGPRPPAWGEQRVCVCGGALRVLPGIPDNAGAARRCAPRSRPRRPLPQRAPLRRPPRALQPCPPLDERARGKPGPNPAHGRALPTQSSLILAALLTAPPQPPGWACVGPAGQPSGPSLVALKAALCARDTARPAPGARSESPTPRSS